MRRARLALLEIEVREQVLGEHVQPLDDPLSSRRALAIGEVRGRGLHLVEVVGDAPVIRLELVDDGTYLAVGLAQAREQEHVLGVVVAVDEAAVAQAVDLEPPQRPVRLELVELRVELLGGQPVDDLAREPPHRFEVAANDAVHPQQLLEERAALFGLRVHAAFRRQGQATLM